MVGYYNLFPMVGWEIKGQSQYEMANKVSIVLKYTSHPHPPRHTVWVCWSKHFDLYNTLLQMQIVNKNTLMINIPIFLICYVHFNGIDMLTVSDLQASVRWGLCEEAQFCACQMDFSSLWRGAVAVNYKMFCV